MKPAHQSERAGETVPKRSATLRGVFREIGKALEGRS